MWILWRYLPLREMGINVEMQTLSHSFPSEGMLPCNYVLIGWLHQLPSSQSSGRLGTRGTITNTFTERTFARTQMETRT